MKEVAGNRDLFAYQDVFAGPSLRRRNIMGKTTDKLRSEMRRHAAAYIAEITEKPQHFITGALKEFTETLRSDTRTAVLAALGIETKWGEFEVKDDGILGNMLKAGLAEFIANECARFADEVVLTVKERAALEKEAKSIYLRKLSHRLENRIEERNDAMTAEEGDLLIDSVVGPVEEM